MKNMSEQSVTGELLPEISKNDLLAFGITAFADRVNIHKSFQKIINESQQEGNNTNYI